MIQVLAVSYALSGSLQSASPSQRRLAEITEMIHTASLFHDDVIDKVGAHVTNKRQHQIHLIRHPLGEMFPLSIKVGVPHF